MTRKRIVIVGGGAGGLELASGLGRDLGGFEREKSEAEIVLVDANATHLWKPLLHQVAAGTMNSYQDELSYLAQGRSSGFRFQYGRMDGLQPAERRVTLAALIDDDGETLLPPRDLSYDLLVLAVGSVGNDFGTPGVQEFCHFIDSRAQAEQFHRDFLIALARRSLTEDDTPLSVVIVGGGATGVELAAELRHATDIAEEYGLSGSARRLNVTIVEQADRLLGGLSEKVATETHKALTDIGIDIRIGQGVSKVEAQSVTLEDGTVLPATLSVWSAGMQAPPFLKDLPGLTFGQGGRIKVGPALQAEGQPDIFALGDCALFIDPKTDKPLGARAQVAHQQASFLRKALAAKLRGQPLPDFRFREHGTLISLSRFEAFGSLGDGRKKGHTAFINGLAAKLAYRMLHRSHQYAVMGLLGTAAQMATDLLRRANHAQVKFH